MKFYVDKHNLPVTIVNDHNVYKNRTIGRYANAASITEIHLNAGPPSARGTEVLILKGYPPDARDKRLLKVLTKYWKDRGFKERNDLYNMNTTKVNYRLLELCFITNSEDMKILKTKMGEIARELLEAVLGTSIEEAEVKPEVLYKVQTGAFASKANADKHLKEVRKHFPKAFITKEGK